jgi:hypothetical protein
MGEAKRRKRLDPNYGQDKKQIAVDLQQMISSSPMLQEMAINQILEQSDFWLQKTDLLYEPVAHSQGERLFWTTQPMPSKQNTARSYFTQNELAARKAIYPLVERFGSGWIYQLGNLDINMTYFHYIPATQENLENLAQEQFCGSMGQTIEFIIRTALQKWEWGKCVPVIATTVGKQDPIWIYIV